MTKYFVLPLSNCYDEFEKEFYYYFEDFDYNSWLRTSYDVHIHGYKDIEHIYIVIHDGVADFNYTTHFGYCEPAGTIKVQKVEDLLRKIYEILDVKIYEILDE